MITLRFTKQAIADCTASGPVDESVDCWAYSMRKQLDRNDKEQIRRYLKEFGAWDEEELLDDYANRRRLIWTAASTCKDIGTCIFQGY